DTSGTRYYTSGSVKCTMKTNIFYTHSSLLARGEAWTRGSYTGCNAIRTVRQLIRVVAEQIRAVRGIYERSQTDTSG
ncbi:hypothetical protein, partial [Sporosarcina cyprini]|uniref:hypothetical protein n=1 Tax=Sporosarcina cyprini TaxID=2910523 RepID=UPI001EE07FF6